MVTPKINSLVSFFLKKGNKCNDNCLLTLTIKNMYSLLANVKTKTTNVNMPHNDGKI